MLLWRMSLENVLCAKWDQSAMVTLNTMFASKIELKTADEEGPNSK